MYDYYYYYYYYCEGGLDVLLLADRRPAKHRQRAARPHSPYSTDSNYSAAAAASASRPRRPYPKSERRRQLMGSAGGSGGDSSGGGEHRRLPSNHSSPQMDRLWGSGAGGKHGKLASWYFGVVNRGVVKSV